MRPHEFMSLVEHEHSRSSCADPWVVRPNPRPDAAFRLFCFPAAGCGAGGYDPGTAGLPDGVELCVMQLPGRENRLDELPFTRMEELVGALAGVLRPYLDRPFGFAGHGAGALIAFYLTRHLRRTRRPGPEQLWVSGCPAPQVVGHLPPVSLLPPQALVAEAVRQGALDSGLLERPDELALMLPALAADLAVCERAWYQAEAPLACGISVVGGLQDRAFPWWQLQAWQAQTAGPFRLRLLPGGHVSLREMPEQWLGALATEIVAYAG